VELGGYYHPDSTQAAQAMRPSQLLNAAIAQL
jgi:monomeric isocitrate dehydrogenase